MTKNRCKQQTVETEFVDHLPDLIVESDYLDPPERKRVRVELRVTADGIEVLGDSMYAHKVEELLEQMGAKSIERMLCG